MGNLSRRSVEQYNFDAIHDTVVDQEGEIIGLAPDYVPDHLTDDDMYDDDLQTLINGSINRNFDPYHDIPWNDPDYAVTDHDPRWILPPHIDLGKTEWYQNLTEAQQIAIGQWRMAGVAKVGEQFERLLVQAISIVNMGVRSGDKNREYSDLEAREEMNHIMMFEKLVDRTGVDTKGARTWFRKALPLIVPGANLMPGGMWAVVLAGEEPIDHMQKEMLRDGADNMHPLMRDIMAIHVAEEGRHISYAHRRLKKEVPQMTKGDQASLAVMMPAAMRILGDVIEKPSPEELKKMGVPDEVSNQLWGSKTKQARQARRDRYPDARMLAEEIGLKTGEGKRTVVSTIGDVAWKAFRIDGRASRYRSEPNRTHSLENA